LNLFRRQLTLLLLKKKLRKLNNFSEVI